MLPKGKAFRYGAIVGEDAQAWSGVTTVGRKEEWPGWTPTETEKRRLGPLLVSVGVHPGHSSLRPTVVTPDQP